MDDKPKARAVAPVETPHLFTSGQCVLHSGERSSFKIDCDALTEADLECIADLLVVRLPKFGEVEGVPRGGIRLANHLQKYCTDGPLLIVDDVFTTGNSMLAQRGDREAIGAVIFSRGCTIPWITSLFSMAVAPVETPGEDLT